MFCIKLFRPLLCAGLVLLLGQVAMALPLPDPPYETGTFSGSSWGGTWNSDIECTAINGTNVISSTSLTQSAIVNCTLSTVSTPAICQLDITYSRTAGLTTSGATQCQDHNDNTSTLTDVAFCGNASNGLTVVGTLDCNPQNLTGTSLPPICGGNVSCTANLDGITSVPNGQCSDVFPLDTGAGLAAGQVLKASVKTTGSTCEGQIVALGDIKTRFCNSGSFNPADPARCKFGSVKATIDGETTTYLPVEVVVSPETVNVKCDPKKDNGSVSFTILGNQSVDVTQIDPDSLELEGVQVSSCGDATFVNSDGFLDLSCTVRSCPLLGPAVKAAIIPGTKTATIQVTGSLKDSGTEIFGEDTVKTSP